MVKHCLMNSAGTIAAKSILLAFFAFLLPDAARSSQNILVLGDSIAAGLGVDPAQSYPALLQSKIDAAGLPFKVINAGVSGDTSADGIARIRWLLRRPFGVLILELGGNDGLRGLPPAATETNLQTIINLARAKDPSVKIIIAGMRMPSSMGGPYVDSFAQIFPDLARRNHAALVPFLLDGVGGVPELNQPDGIHPTPQGHAIVAENVWKILKPFLQ
jgi:acyl-CoA thioesterase-1